LIDAAQLVQQEEETTSRELTDMLEPGERAEGLKAVELALLAFLGVKVVVPIVCSFVGRELWERYDRIRSRSQAREAREELADQALSKATVEPAKVLAPIIESLLEEGVPAEQAARIAENTYRRISERVATHE